MYEFNNIILITLLYKRYCIVNRKIIRIEIIFNKTRYVYHDYAYRIHTICKFFK